MERQLADAVKNERAQNESLAEARDAVAKAERTSQAASKTATDAAAEVERLERNAG